MTIGRQFLGALLISTAIHGLIIIPPEIFNLNITPALKKNKTVSVAYIKNIPKPIEAKKNLSVRSEPLLRLPPKITIEKRIQAPKRPAFPGRQSVEKPELIKSDVAAAKKKIIIPPAAEEKQGSKNPAYISYEQIVREKIKRAAYQAYDEKEAGSVNLSFIVLPDGSLKEWRFAEKSSSSPYLREIASQSLDQASPFPFFPKELGAQETAFNLTIIFETE